ncbi:hypothetical protein [Lysobacter sp. FW306-1B-D06B]|uniref:hypothetical protein n=1 Tax=Lysobacter sp. FW306-1B-D06B TaxID=3140250 RepID=UPI0031404D7F
MRRYELGFSLCLMMLGVASCARPPGEERLSIAAIAPKPNAETLPKDVFERSSQAIVGITYPTGLVRYPRLASMLAHHAATRRAALQTALAANPTPSVPYELTLRFTTVADSPRLFAVRAEEDLYIGGMASTPRSSTFIWLPGADRLLKPNELLADASSWAQVDRYIHDRMLEEGAALPSQAESGSRDRDFFPRMDSDGQIAGLVFSLPEGNVEVPAAVLRTLIASGYSDLLSH